MNTDSLLFLSLAGLEKVKQELALNHPVYTQAYEMLIEEAKAELTQPIFSVMDKQLVPPSGDKHDYMSLGIYWWPNPDTSDGIPYIRHDGIRNPEIEQMDGPAMSRMCEQVQTLTLAYYYSEEKAYALRACEQMRAWFLDPATRMNPHLEFGQGIPGICTGRDIGIIETWILPRLLDYIVLLYREGYWKEEDQDALRCWFSEYLTWLRTSKHGRGEEAQHNNHGTYYDMQVGSYALFCSKPEIARDQLNSYFADRIIQQMEPDGRQPHELTRTLAFSYSIMNLNGFMDLATIGSKLDMNLWSFTTRDGRSLKKALDWLVSFMDRMDTFPYEQIGPVKMKEAGMLLRRSSYVYGESCYEDALREMLGKDPSIHRLNLTYPIMSYIS